MSALTAKVAQGNRLAGTSYAPNTLVEAANRHVAWFHELEGWTEYWDIYHPESGGRYHFGNGSTEPGLLRRFLPRERRPTIFNSWVKMALSLDTRQKFVEEARAPEVAAAVLEVDRFFSRLFKKHFGDAADPEVQSDYVNAMLCFGCGTFPPALERAARVQHDDSRKANAPRYTIYNDLTWFGWALHVEAVHAIIGADEEHARRSLQLAGLAVGCSADFAWHGHRRTRGEYSTDFQTAYLLRNEGIRWAQDFKGAVKEVHALFRIREWGRE